MQCLSALLALTLLQIEGMSSKPAQQGTASQPQHAMAAISPEKNKGTDKEVCVCVHIHNKLYLYF